MGVFMPWFTPSRANRYGRSLAMARRTMPGLRKIAVVVPVLILPRHAHETRAITADRRVVREMFGRVAPRAASAAATACAHQSRDVEKRRAALVATVPIRTDPKANRQHRHELL